MTFGETIAEARKRKGMKMEALSNLIGKSMAAMSGYENNTRLPDPWTVVKIAEELGSESILFTYLENNPVYKATIPKVFPDLNNIRTEPMAIFTKLARELEEARESALILADIFSHMDPKRVPAFEDLFKRHMEQIVDGKRCIEILEFRLLALEILTKESLLGIYDHQQHKCEEHGHHLPAKTGTEG